MDSAAIEHKLQKIEELDEEDKISLIREIARERYLEALPVLSKMLLDATGGVRETLIDSLTDIGGEETVENLVKLMYHQNFRARNDAMEIMTNIGEMGIPVLIPYLEDESEDIRKFIVDMFGVIASPLAVEHLLKLKNDPDVNVRSAVAESLGKIGDYRAVETLLELLDDDEWTRTYVIEALASFEDPVVSDKLLPLIDEDNPMIILPTLKTLGEVGDEKAVSLLFEKLGDKDELIDSFIIQAIGKIADRLGLDFKDDKYPQLNDNLSIILDNLDNEDEEVSDMAAFLLSKIHSSRSLRFVVRFARSKEEIPYPLEDILSTPDEICTKAILEEITLENAKNPVFFIRALGNSNMLEVAPFLLKCLESDDEEIRMAAISALGNIRDESSIPKVIPMLSDPVGHVRRTAARCLGGMRSKEAIPELLKTVRDEYEDVRMEAAKALVNIGGEEIPVEFLKMLQDKDEAIRTTGIFGFSISDNVGNYENEILDVLNDADWKVRKYAVIALGKIKTERVIDNLILSLSDENNEVKMKVINLLCESNQSNACEAVLPMLNDSDVWVRYETARSIRKIKNEEVIDALIACLDDESPVVQVAALESLGEIGGEKAAMAVERMLNAEDFEVQDTAQMVFDNLLLKEGIMI